MLQIAEYSFYHSFQEKKPSSLTAWGNKDTCSVYLIQKLNGMSKGVNFIFTVREIWCITIYMPQQIFFLKPYIKYMFESIRYYKIAICTSDFPYCKIAIS